jgi:hypothetical protein
VYKTNRGFLLVMIVLALAALACSLLTGGAKTQTPEAAQLTEASGGAGAGSATAASPTKALETAPTATEANPSGDVPDLEQGLTTLPSYRASFNVSVVSKDEKGNDTNGQAQIVQDTINTDQSQHTLITYSGTLGSLTGQNGQFELYRLAGIYYLLNNTDPANPQCNIFSAGETAMLSMLISPKAVIGAIHNPKLVKTGEEVNGIQTNHYTYDQTNLSGSQLTNAKGDLWVAQEGDYVVRLTGTAVGANLAQLQDPNAAVTYDYNIDLVGKVTKIEAPQSCAALPADIPTPPNTRLDTAVGSIFRLFSTDSPASVADFFRAQLPANGWKAGDDIKAGEMYTLKFTKEARTLDIIINQDAGGTSILISE